MRQKTYVLAKAILERRDVLFGSNETSAKPQSMKEKEDAWEAVRAEMIDQGFMNFTHKSWRDVRNHDWQYLRRSAVAKYEHNQKAGSEHIQYNEVDKLVFEIMGSEVINNHDDQHMANETEHPFSFNQMPSSLDDSNIQTSNNGKHQQLNSFLNTSSSAITAAPILSRKRSWDTASPAVMSPREAKYLPNTIQLSEQVNTELASINGLSEAEIPVELLQSIIASSQFIHSQQKQPSSRYVNNEANSQPTAFQEVHCSDLSRNRASSSSSLGTKSTEDELTEAKLRLTLLQIRKEEIILQQEQCKLIQEESKVRQERAKMELLEMQLDAERTKSIPTLQLADKE